MRPIHVCAAVLVAVAWGINFIVIDVGLRHFPPLLFASLRFTLTAFPAVLVVRRPAIPWRWIIAVGLFLSAGQFALLFTAMHLGLPAGLSSLVLQAQAIFTMVFAALILGERPGGRQWTGIAIASAGMVTIAIARGAAAPVFPLLLGIAAAACWGTGNVCTRLAQPPPGLGLLVWSSLIAPGPLLAASLCIEGPAQITHAFGAFNPDSVAALGYVVLVSTFGGFGIWTGLLRRYPASSVAPFTLLVPVVGMASAAALTGEHPAPAELAGAAIVVLGLLILGVTRSHPRTEECEIRQHFPQRVRIGEKGVSGTG